MRIRWRYQGDHKISYPRLIARKASTLIRLQLGIPEPSEYVSFLGRTLLLRRGTVRRFVDEDDAWVLACAKHASCMFDIGCNIGYTALLGLIGGTISEIVLVDASSQALSIAANNLIQNGLSSRARFVWAFVATRAGAVSFFTGDAGQASSAYIKNYRHSYRGKEIEVETLSVDSLVNEYNTDPDFIKVDVEGAEDLVLSGSCAVASKRRCRFIVEVHDLDSKPIQDTTISIINWCAELKYTGWILQTHEKLRALDQISNRNRYHLMLQPDDWDYPYWLKQIAPSTEVN